jgi:hypothetical protein
MLDILIGVESILLIYALFRGIMATRYFWHLVRDDRQANERPSRLLRWLALTVSAITGGSAYFAILIAVRLLSGSRSPEWTIPISGAVLVAILLVPDYIAGRIKTLRKGRDPETPPPFSADD